MYLVFSNTRKVALEYSDAYDEKQWSLWDGDSVTLFVTRKEAAQAITDTQNYQHGAYKWSKDEYFILSAEIFKGK